MASGTLQHHCLLLCSLLVPLIASFSEAATSFRPKALVLPVTKDPSTRQYLTQINQRKPLVPVKLTLDLGGQLLWVDCEQQFFLNSFGPVGCKTAQCNLVIGNICLTTYCNSSKCGNNTCGLLADNTLSKVAQTSILGEDVVSIQSTDGSKPGQVVSVPDFLMTCGGDLQGLPSGVKGMAGLGRTRVSLPSQFSEAFGLARKFAVCLSPSTRANGVVFFGDGPYVLLPNVDVSKSLIYTPLLINPFTTASSYYKREPSSEYFIGVTSIKINNKAVPLNSSLLSITKEGYGGTKISTVYPYTVLETSIYEAVVNAFVKELAHVPRVTSVAPFGACFNSTTISSTRVGPAVPAIDLFLPSTSRTRVVYWRIFGANSMVQVKNDVLCLGFVDGGENPRTSIVIGGHQLEDNLLQFDLASSRLGFSSSLLSRQTTCANFNFTSKA